MITGNTPESTHVIKNLDNPSKHMHAIEIKETFLKTSIQSKNKQDL